MRQQRTIDLRFLPAPLLGLGLGLGWAWYNLLLAGSERSEATLPALVWVMFAAPAALLLGWLLARWREWRLALACCGALYFFTFFVAARLESLVDPAVALTVGPHQRYFEFAMVLHGVVGMALISWRAVRGGQAERAQP